MNKYLLITSNKVSTKLEDVFISLVFISGKFMSFPIMDLPGQSQGQKN